MTSADDFMVFIIYLIYHDDDPRMRASMQRLLKSIRGSQHEHQ
jgi:hypothetical protein